MKKTLLALVACLTIVGITSPTALAWTFDVSGQGACQPDGSYTITWNIQNPESQDLTVTKSNRAAVPVGSIVPKKKNNVPGSVNFTETNVDGTKAGSHSLTIKVEWKNDTKQDEKTATVELDEPCAQPVTPGRGAGDTTPQVQSQTTTRVPTGAVNAGSGVSGLSAQGLIGLLTSLAILGLGATRYATNRA